MERFWIVVIGGLLPALGFGLSGGLQKLSSNAGMGVGTYLVYVGVATMIVGLGVRLVLQEPGWNVGHSWMALAAGLLFSVAVGSIGFAIGRLGAPISLISPITVLGTLVTVVFGLVVLKETQSVAVTKLLIGAVLVVAGAALVATS